MMHIQNLSKSFGSKTVLNDINILFEEGKVYGIVGENGAGKTTLFNCIAGLEGYDGRITSDHEKLKEHLGYLQTNPYFSQRSPVGNTFSCAASPEEKKILILTQRIFLNFRWMITHPFILQECRKN